MRVTNAHWESSVCKLEKTRYHMLWPGVQLFTLFVDFHFLIRVATGCGIIALKLLIIVRSSKLITGENSLLHSSFLDIWEFLVDNIRPQMINLIGNLSMSLYLPFGYSTVTITGTASERSINANRVMRKMSYCATSWTKDNSV